MISETSSGLICTHINGGQFSVWQWVDLCTRLSTHRIQNQMVFPARVHEKRCSHMTPRFLLLAQWSQSLTHHKLRHTQSWVINMDRHYSLNTPSLCFMFLIDMSWHHVIFKMEHQSFNTNALCWAPALLTATLFLLYSDCISSKSNKLCFRNYKNKMVFPLKE